MKSAIFYILLLFSIEALSQQSHEQDFETVANYTDDTGYQVIEETRKHTGIPFDKGDFGSPYKNCEAWLPESIKINGDSHSLPGECISYRVCMEEPIPGESVLISCPCYEDLTNRHPGSWDEDHAYFIRTVLGSGDTIEQAKQSAKGKCQSQVGGILEDESPIHQDFGISGCRQIGQEVCGKLVFLMK